MFRGIPVAVEFKRCGGGKINADTYETVCAFLNRFGGDIYLGVEDNCTVCGVPKKATPDLVKNFINMVSNPDIINPTVYLTPEIIEYEGEKVIHIHIPPSSEVHYYKGVIFDRIGDADVKVKGTGQIAQLYIRKHRIFTEKKVFPYIKDEDLRFDLIPQLRQMAINRSQNHPWKTMTDSEILQSVGLIGKDPETGKTGYNLATVMLLGRDDVILSVSPTHRTDALLRKVNVDRYDDRVIVQTNLIESYL
jgi:ATP-dependent DNA helicase RecG